MPILSFEQARSEILNRVSVLEAEERPLLKTLGQAAAEDIVASLNVPDWDASALDGFAVISADIQDATWNSPRILKVIETVTAGHQSGGRVKAGEAVRIMTGAPMPAGTDCVVGFEDSDEADRQAENRGHIGILKSFAPRANIRPAGEQIRKGASMLSLGTKIGPAELGLLASLGLTAVKVVRRPLVAIIATGEELESPGRPLAGPKIYVGNSSALAAQVSRCGGIPRILGIARDNLSSIRNKIRRALHSDLILTTGGSATGDRDLVKEVMHEMGELVFTQLAMTPGKSTAMALFNKAGSEPQRVVHLALSGNPTAAMLTFEALARPALLKMQGLPSELELVSARAAAAFSNPGGKTRLVWVSVTDRQGSCLVGPAGSENRGVLYSISEAQGIALIPPIIRQISAGDEIHFIPLDWS